MTIVHRPAATKRATAPPAYPDVRLFIDGAWCESADGRHEPVVNPATGTTIGNVPFASRADLDRALAAAERGFATWRKVSAYQRSRMMHDAARLLRARSPEIARTMVLEHGKPLREAGLEIEMGADVIDWFAGETQRAYGRVIPARLEGVISMVVKEPVGVVAAFSPWNFPINQAVRKISIALAAGCSIIIKGPDGTPASINALVQTFVDAGVPAGVINLVYGVPADISEYLIPHPVIRKISFTGSTPVGKHLAALAGTHMKRATMELGGHAPSIVFDDADVDLAVRVLAASKVRNAGQVCISPTRFIVQRGVYDEFVTKFTAAIAAVKVGDGLAPDVMMGPLINEKRVRAMEGLVADAVRRGARVATGGKRLYERGFFYAPTVLTNVPLDAAVMNDEPFGPLAPVVPFDSFEDAVREANRLAYGLASYVYTRSLKTATAIGAAIEAGMVSINQHGLGLPELTFSGVKDSGYGSEGGTEAIEAYLIPKLITQAT